MLNFPVQVLVNQTGYLHSLEKNKHGKHRDNYHRDYYQNNRQRINHLRRKHYSNLFQPKQTWRWRELFKTPKPYCFYCFQAKVSPYWLYYCGKPNCSVITWLENQKKKQLEKEGWFYDFNLKLAWRNLTPKKRVKKRGKKESWCYTKNDPFPPARSSLTIARTWAKGFTREIRTILFNETRQKKRFLEQKLDRDYLRLKTVGKIPQKKGWTELDYREQLNKEQLIERCGEWSVRGGGKIGNKFLSFLDIDVEKGKVPLSWQRHLRKNVNLLLDYLNCSYVKTKDGNHVYLLTDELLPNQILYHVDKFGKRRIIGSIQSKGKYVVGFDSVNKELVERDKCFYQSEDLNAIKRTLGKFFVEVGDKKETKRELGPLIEIQPQVQPSLYLNQNVSYGRLKQEQTRIQSTILSKYKTLLPHLWKVFYSNQKTQTTGYFLANDYQRGKDFNNLNLGSTQTITLIQGYRHSFLGRLC